MKNRFIVCLTVLAAFLAPDAKAEALDLGAACADAAFWKSDPVLFVKRHETLGFKFTDASRRQTDTRRDGAVACFGIPVYESRVVFGDEGGIARVELMLYNPAGTESVEEIKTADGGRMRRLVRRDRPVTREEFFKILADVRAQLTPKGGKTPQPQNERTRDAKIRQRVQAWPPNAAAAAPTLCWNYSQEGKRAETFQPGFIRLAFDGPGAAGGAAVKKSGKKSARGKQAIAENVAHDSRGTFVDSVPMVDQGMKGYCAVATAERVLRYYGIDVDEHEIAEAAGTTAEEGTSQRGMKEAVERIGKRYKLATVRLYGDSEESGATRIANLDREVANYNKMAKKMKREPIAASVYVRQEGNMTMYDPSAVDRAMDAEVLKEMKTNGAQKSKFTKFRKDVRQYVDQGIPLLWSVKLGVYPEPNLPQTIGGHMRLVIGYSDKGGGEILYSDSWGQGHELKSMPIAWAWTITKGLLVLKPNR